MGERAGGGRKVGVGGFRAWKGGRRVLSALCWLQDMFVTVTGILPVIATVIVGVAVTVIAGETMIMIMTQNSTD